MKVFGVAGYAFVHLSNFVVDLFMYVASGVDFRLEGKQKNTSDKPDHGWVKIKRSEHQ